MKNKDIIKDKLSEESFKIIKENINKELLEYLFDETLEKYGIHRASSKREPRSLYGYIIKST